MNSPDQPESKCSLDERAIINGALDHFFDSRGIEHVFREPNRHVSTSRSITVLGPHAVSLIATQGPDQDYQPWIHIEHEQPHDDGSSTVHGITFDPGNGVKHMIWHMEERVYDPRIDMYIPKEDFSKRQMPMDQEPITREGALFLAALITEATNWAEHPKVVARRENSKSSETSPRSIPAAYRTSR